MLKGNSSKKKETTSELEEYLKQTSYYNEPLLEPITNDYSEEPILKPLEFYQEEPTIEAIIETYEQQSSNYETNDDFSKVEENTDEAKNVLENTKDITKINLEEKVITQLPEANQETNNYNEKFSLIDEYEKETIKYKRSKKIINIVFIIVIVIMTMISIDVICISRYNKGPFFAIKTNTLKDGGTKIYYGIGYKVIKYHQVQGRRDAKIGFWTMPYSTNPTNISALDLAIEFRNNPEKTSKKYYKSFLRINGTVKKVNEKKNQVIIEYKDPDQKYTLQIICPIAEKKEDLSFSKNQEITVIGTAQNFTIKTNSKPNTLYMSNCFAKNS